MSAVLPSPRWQRRAEARPQELLEAALAVFVERGYAATRLDEVARRAGVAKATLYLYYANKLELFKAVVRHALIAGLDEAALGQVEMPEGSRARLSRLLRLFGQRVACSPLSGIPKLVMAEAGNFPEVARFYHDEVIRRGRDLVTGILRRGIETGEFRAIDVDHAWRAVIAPLLLAIIWKHSFQAFDPEPWDFERHLEAHLDLLFNGLAAAPDKTEG
ncbi:MAG: TetR/AcrR family transcriptional regulator [Thiobacillus sp.]|nr:TetR/AcrR family transcriptional regulator [Thiobacillus sp.]